MIIEKYNNEQETKVRRTWKFKNDDQDYESIFNACNNPFCPCSDITFSIQLQGKTVGSINFDIATDKCKPNKLKDVSDTFSKKMILELSVDDKQTLVQIFRNDKLRSEKNIDFETVEPPVFPVNEIENESVLIAYTDIFPWAKDYFFSIDDKKYYLVDQYCLDSKCKCNNAVLYFAGFIDKVCFTEDNPVMIMYKCNSGKWEIYREGKDFVSPATLIKELLNKYPDFQKIVSERRVVLKKLYKKYLEKIAYKINQSEEKPVLKKLGRNDPCFCGSGKKFKKCCGNKL